VLNAEATRVYRIAKKTVFEFPSVSKSKDRQSVYAPLAVLLA